MFRIAVMLIALVGFLAGCEEKPRVDENGNVVRIFWIKEKMIPEIQFRHLDTVNAVREANGLAPVALSAELNAAAQTHALDMSRQNRPWHFGSDGSSPLDRVARAGYPGGFVSENLSETFEDDLLTLQAWLDDPLTREGILSPNAQFVGFSWFQEENGKLWWVQLLGS
jgi:uncharacterized protein YkwD